MFSGGGHRAPSSARSNGSSTTSAAQAVQIPPTRSIRKAFLQPEARTERSKQLMIENNERMQRIQRRSSETEAAAAAFEAEEKAQLQKAEEARREKLKITREEARERFASQKHRREQAQQQQQAASPRRAETHIISSPNRSRPWRSPAKASPSEKLEEVVASLQAAVQLAAGSPAAGSGGARSPLSGAAMLSMEELAARAQAAAEGRDWEALEEMITEEMTTPEEWPRLEPERSELLTLVRIGRSRREWCFSELADSIAAATLPNLPAGGHLRLQTTAADGDHATGGRVWHSTPVLCRWLLSESAAMRGASVLELGSGTGAAGLFAAALGASTVVLTDGASELLRLMAENVRQNRQLCPAATACEVGLLQWGASEHASALGSRCFDLVLGSDVIYDASSHAALCQTLRGLFDRQLAAPPRVMLATMPRSRVALREDPTRFTDAALVSFEAEAASHGMRVRALGKAQSAWTSAEWCDAAPFVFEVVTSQ